MLIEVFDPLVFDEVTFGGISVLFDDQVFDGDIFDLSITSIFIRAVINRDGVLAQVLDSEIGSKKALVFSGGLIIEQSPLIGKALIYESGVIREITASETLII